MHERQAVDEDRDVVAGRARCSVDVDLVLVDHLQPVVVDVPLVDQADVLERPVVAREDLDVVLLDPRRLLDDPLVRARDLLGEEPLPLVVAELDPVERLELRAQVGDQRGLARDPQVLVGLSLRGAR